MGAGCLLTGGLLLEGNEVERVEDALEGIVDRAEAICRVCGGGSSDEILLEVCVVGV